MNLSVFFISLYINCGSFQQKCGKLIICITILYQSTGYFTSPQVIHITFPPSFPHDVENVENFKIYDNNRVIEIYQFVESRWKVSIILHFSTFLLIHSWFIHKFSMWIGVYNVDKSILIAYFHLKNVENYKIIKNFYQHLFCFPQSSSSLFEIPWIEHGVFMGFVVELFHTHKGVFLCLNL